MTGRKHIVLLGSTGSIGKSALDVIGRHPRRFRIEALAANRNARLILAQTRKYKPARVALAEPAAYRFVRDRVRRWKNPPRVEGGMEGIRRAAVMPAADLVLSAMAGSAGLLPTWDAIQAGKDVALANKETLVMAGELVLKAVRRRKVRLLPVDSEHAALAQCLQGHKDIPIRRLILTASGGPFYRLSQQQLRRVTVRQTLRHPTWSMGKKITVDSATLMNKGLEVIEAHHLFGVPYDKIEVTIHPQSIVHSLVEYVDGSCLAQMSNPDMRLPIQAALTEPERLNHIIHPLDFRAGLALTFHAPDIKRFPGLALAYSAGRKGGAAPAVCNAANEVAVQGFLDQQLDFVGIPRIIAYVLKRFHGPLRPSLDDILQADAWARKVAKEAMTCSL